MQSFFPYFNELLKQRFLLQTVFPPISVFDPRPFIPPHCDTALVDGAGATIAPGIMMQS